LLICGPRFFVYRRTWKVSKRLSKFKNIRLSRNKTGSHQLGLGAKYYSQKIQLYFLTATLFDGVLARTTEGCCLPYHFVAEFTSTGCRELMPWCGG
jgi:hypothetical protein